MKKPLEQTPFTQAWLEERLRRIATSREGPPVDAQELRHLAHVILQSSILLGAAYTDERMRAILGGDSDLAIRPAPPAELAGTDKDAFSRVRRVPDEVRAVGNQCLFDVGISGVREFRGVSLEELGVRAYKLASEILSKMSEDPRLRDYFEDNRLWPMPLTEEVIFLRQCAGRFSLHADLLQRLVLDPASGAEREADTGGPSVFFPGNLPAGDETEDVVLSAAVPAPPPEVAGPAEAAVGVGAGPVSDAIRGRDTSPRSREELLSAYERLLLFSQLDVEAMRHELSATVVGQQDAVDTLCDELSLFAAGTHDPDKPPAYFFAGPTGVGKNYLVESLSRYLSRLWDVEVPFLQIEGPDYTDPSDINELRGSSRGFIRSDEEGLLAGFHERVTKAPFSCLLVDEVEKAHAHLRKYFLSLMDRGTLTDNRGRTLRFSGTMLVFTSNAGYGDRAVTDLPIGYRSDETRESFEISRAERGLRSTLSPEFMNRLKIVRFRHLSQDSIERILDLELEQIAVRFRQLHHLDLTATPRARREMLSQGYSYEFGARHLSAALDRICNVEVARMIRRDEDQSRQSRTDLVAWLRQMRDGERSFDETEVRDRVLEEARARLPYGRIEIDHDGRGFVYRGIA